MGKINLVSKVFKREVKEASEPLKGLVTTRHSCFCTGGNKIEHTWDSPGCIYYQPKKTDSLENPQPQQLQLLPPPKGNVGEMFEKQTNSAFRFTTGNKVTRDMEMLVQAYNKAVKENPLEYLNMTDTDSMSLTFAYHVTRELAAMGYWIEESPFE